jgi:hypothetical protein
VTNQKVDFEYVFSGTNMMNLLPFKKKDNHTQEYNDLKMKVITDGVLMIKKECAEMFNEFNVKTSILYNAYVEPKKGDGYNNYNNVGFDDLYADSGGLQVVTQGSELTEELKLKIYEQQKNAKYAFCFDEIPVENKSGVTALAGGGRANVSMKQFDYSRFKECAERTGVNINNQLNAFEGTNTQGFYIVQGNTYQDMVDWVRWGGKKIHNLDYLAGIAPADTCMGNGELESCDMIMASRIIYDEFENINKRMHLLGIGAPTRMLPVIQLMKSGFLENVNISFDSSSNAMAMMNGNFKNDGISAKNPKDIEKSIESFIVFFKPMFKEYIGEFDNIELRDYIVSKLRFFTKIEDDAFSEKPHFVPITGSIVPLYCAWLNIGFFKQCKNMISDQKLSQTAIGLLSEVRSPEDYIHWRTQFKNHIKSARMYRKRDVDLSDFFGE